MALELSIAEAFQQALASNPNPKPVSEQEGAVIGGIFFPLQPDRMLDLVNKRARITSFTAFYPTAAQRMETQIVLQLLKEVGSNGIRLDALKTDAFYNENKDALSFRYAKFYEAGSAPVQDNFLSNFRGAAFKP
ncbi:hypothetical protein HDU77_007287 [Chytriomyces hyalinus]|nr:hypothetical protein HDU77_007287 [Chytriomyces hyalinus]